MTATHHNGGLHSGLIAFPPSVMALLLLTACAALTPPPLPAPAYVSATEACRNLINMPESYARCAGIVNEGNSIKRDMHQNAVLQSNRDAAAMVTASPPFVPPMTWPNPSTSPLPNAPSYMAAPIGDPCAMMSCPRAAPPPVQYVPVAPGDPLNAGLNSYGYPTR